MALKPFNGTLDAPSPSGLKPFNGQLDGEEPEGGLIASLKQTVGQGIKGAGQAAADYLPGVSQDNALKSYGQEVIDANPTAVRSLSDIATSPWTATKEAVGNAVGSMGAMVGANVAGRGLEAVAPFTGPARPVVSLLGKGLQVAGPVVAAGLPSYGGIREAQIQDDPTRADDAGAKARALAGAGAVGLIERSFGPEKLALSALSKEGRAKVIESMAGKSLAGSIGKGMAKGAAVEGAEELAQNPIEQFAAYQDPTTPENIEETLFGGAMGALGGGVLGGAGGGASYMARPEQPQVDPTAGPLSRAAATAQQTGAAGLAQAAQQANAAQGDTQAAQPDADPLAGLSARLTPEAMRAIRQAEGYGPESVNEVLRAYQIARNPELDANTRQQATEALNSFWQGFDNRPNWTRPNPQPEQAPQPGTDVVPFGQGTDVAAPGAPSPFDPNTLDGQAREVGTLPRQMLAGPEDAAAQYRRELLDSVLSDPETKNPLPRYESLLKKNGFEQRRATPEERKLIEDRTRPAEPERPALPPFAAVDQAIMDSGITPDNSGKAGMESGKAGIKAAFPMTQAGAERRAAEQTQATGQQFEAVPHPTIAGRFVAQPVAQPAPTLESSDVTLTNEGNIQPTNALLNSGEIGTPAKSRQAALRTKMEANQATSDEIDEYISLVDQEFAVRRSGGKAQADQWFETPERARSFLTESGYQERNGTFEKDGEQRVRIVPQSTGRGGVALELDEFAPDVEDGIAEAAKLAGRTEKETRSIYRNMVEKNGKEYADDLLRKTVEKFRTQGTPNETPAKAVEATPQRGTAQQAEVTNAQSPLDDAGQGAAVAPQGGQGAALAAPGEAAQGAAVSQAAAAKQGEVAPFDHGLLNLPLSKRMGDIDAQLDRYKRDQAAQAKQQAKADTAQRKTDKARAKELFAQHGEAMVEKFGTSERIQANGGPKALRQELDQMVKWEPAKFVRLAEKFATEQGSANAPEPTQTLPENRQASRPQGAPQGGAQEPGQGLKRIPRGDAKSLVELIRRSGGISSKLASDIAGERTAGKKGYPVGVFRSTGMAEDMLAELLQQNGFLSEADINNPDDTSGAGAAMDLVRQALAGERVVSIAEREAQQANAEERQYRDTIRQQANEAGIKTAFRKFSDIETEVLALMQAKQDRDTAALDAAEQAAYAEELESIRASNVLNDAEIETLIERHQNAPLRELRQLLQEAYSVKIDEINELAAGARAPREFNEQEYRDARAEEEGDGQADARAAGEGAQAGSQSARTGQAQADGFRLESQTEQDLAARDAAQRETAEREQREQQERERKAQADAERGSFTLSGSDRPADVMAAQGQGGLFDPSVSYTANESGAKARKNDTYTQDIFGQPIPDQRLSDPDRTQPLVASSLAVRAAGEAPGAVYATEAGPRQTGVVRSAYERVHGSREAAHVLAGLRKHPQEKFQVLVLDAESKPLAVLNLFAGATTQTSAYPEVVTKAVYETPGAAKVWYAHNHPSGRAEPSTADELLTRELSKAFGLGTGIEVGGHVIIAGERAVEMDAQGSQVGGPFKIPAGIRKHETKITERRFTKVGTLAPNIGSPAEARQAVANIANGRTGVLFLNAQNGPVGFLPMTPEQMSTLRDGQSARLLFGGAARSNAVATILTFEDAISEDAMTAATRNAHDALDGRGIRVLDALHRGKSLAETGTLHGNNGGAFFSRDEPSTGTTESAIWSAVESLVGPLRRRRIVVVQSADVLVEQGILQSRDANGAQAFVRDGKAYFIADAIRPGNERAVFLHEVGAHLGMERILSPLQRSVLLNRIKTWAAQANGSVESRIAQAAQRRVEAAGGQDADLETVAYFVEEAVKAGINPTTDTTGPIGQWFKTLWAALRTALEKLGLVNASKLTAQDVVNLAHGAANVAMSEDATGGGVQFSRAAANIAPVWDVPESSKLFNRFDKDSLIYTLQDKHVDTKRVVEAIRKQSGDIADEFNPYLQEELFHGRSAKGVKDFLDGELRPLLTEMSLRKVDMATLEKFLHARHAEERNIQIAKINPKMPDGGSGMETQEARDYLAALDPAQKALLDKLAAKIDAINASTRQLLVDAGLEKPETIKAWEGAYKHYVPLQREEVDSGGLGIGQGFSVKGSASKRAMGSDKAVADIIANIAMQRERAIVRAEKNRVSQALYALALKAPNPAFWMPINPAEAQAFTPKQQQTVIDELTSMGLDPADAMNFVKEPKQRYIDPRTGLVSERINPVMRSAPNVLATRINGEDRYVFFNAGDERANRMVHALKNLDADQLGRMLQTSAKLTRWFASVNTQYNPVFGAINLTRDVQGAILNLSTTPIRGQEAKVLANTFSALKGIYTDLRAIRKGGVASSQWAGLWEEFQKEGGQTGYRDMFSNATERAEAIQKEIDQLGEGKLKAGGRALFDWLSDYNESMENAVRLAAYKAAKDQGISTQQAASIAKNLTVNFNRKGQITTQAGALYAFFNAAVQGTTRMAQTLNGPAGRKIILGGLTLGAMQAVLLAAAGFDDEDPPEFVRERSIIIPTGGGKYISIPMPLGFHVIPSTSRILTEWALSGFKHTPKRFSDVLSLFADTFNPIGNAGWSMQTLAPTALDPLAALAENRDWSGKPIAREDFNKMAPTPGYSRAKDTASWVSKTIAYWANLATGGTDYKPGMFSPTPDQLDYLIGQFTGGVGREYLKAEQTATSVWTGEDLPPHKIPLLGRFYGDTTGQSSEANRFYSNIKEVNQHKLEIDGRRKDGGDVGEYMRDNPTARLAMVTSRFDTTVRKLRQARRDAVERGDSQERIKALDAQMTNVMRQFNEQFARLDE